MTINFKALLFSTIFLVPVATRPMKLAPSLPLRSQETLDTTPSISFELLFNTLRTAVSHLQCEGYKDKLLAVQEVLKEQYATFNLPATLKQINCITFLLDGSIAQLLADMEYGDAATAMAAYETLKSVWPWKLTQDEELSFLALLEPFTSIEVQQENIAALKTSYTRSALADKLTHTINIIVANMRNNKQIMRPEVARIIKSSMDIIQHTTDPLVFATHVIELDYVLCDLQDQMILKADLDTVPVKRSPGLLARGLEKFFKNVNGSIHSQELEFFVHSVTFSCDVTIGKLYLSAEEYEQRIEQFWQTMEDITPSYHARLSANKWITTAGYYAAEVARFSGMAGLLQYLDELDIQSKISSQAATIATIFKKGLDSFLAKYPLLITTEGVTILGNVVSVASLHDLVAKSQGAIREIIHSVQQLEMHKTLAEGLLAGTKVKTLTGYKYIEDLQVGDIVCGYDFAGCYYERKVIAITDKNISHYVALHVGDQVIFAAPDQKFYLPHTNSWVAAKDISASTILLQGHNQHVRVDEVKLISHEIAAYAITVEDHEFCITEADIHVHNMDPASTITIGALVISNPVITLIGATATLISIGLAVNTTRHTDMPSSDNTIAPKPTKEITSMCTQERLYYEKRKQELLRLRNDFIRAKKDIHSIQMFCDLRTRYFTDTFFLQLPESIVNTAPCLSLDQEIRLNDQQRSVLRSSRQGELHQLEEDILKLQIAIAYHFNELISRKNKAVNELENFLLKLNNNVGVWNGRLSKITLSIAIPFYTNICREEVLIENINHKIYELQRAINHYKGNTSPVIMDTTNIMDVLTQEEGSIKKIQEDIAKYEENIAYNKGVVGQFLTDNNISLARISNKVKGDSNSEREKQKSKEMAVAQQEQVAIQFPKGPKGPKKDDDEDKKKESRDEARKNFRPLANKEAREFAEKLGYKEVANPPFDSKGQLAFRKGNQWITPDRTGHNGGIWKVFRGAERQGTFNSDLTKMIGD